MEKLRRQIPSWSLLIAIIMSGCGSYVSSNALTYDTPDMIEFDVFKSHTCPICGGWITKVGLVGDDRSLPSRNVEVWNRSICGNLFYGENSPICTNCWQAYSRPLKSWNRSSEDAKSFKCPLDESIQSFPLYPHRACYNQKYDGSHLIESIRFSCANSPELLARFRTYAAETGLDLQIQKDRSSLNAVEVTVTGKPKAAPVLQPAKL